MLKTCLEIITEKERGMKLFSFIHMFLTLFMPPTLKKNRTEQNRILLRTPKGYKAREDTTCYIIDGIYDSVKFINDIQTNEI